MCNTFLHITLNTEVLLSSGLCMLCCPFMSTQHVIQQFSKPGPLPHDATINSKGSIPRDTICMCMCTFYKTPHNYCSFRDTSRLTPLILLRKALGISIFPFCYCSSLLGRIQRQQLAAIFSLMKEKAETFGEMSETDIKEQLKLYDM